MLRVVTAVFPFGNCGVLESQSFNVSFHILGLLPNNMLIVWLTIIFMSCAIVNHFCRSIFMSPTVMTSLTEVAAATFEKCLCNVSGSRADKVLIGSSCSSSISKARSSSNSWSDKLGNDLSGNLTTSLLSCLLRGFIKSSLFRVNSVSKFLNPKKDSTLFVIVGVGHLSMPSSFIGCICSWFPGLGNPSYLVPVSQEVYPSDSAKRSLSLVRTLRVSSVSSSFVWIA